MEIKEKMNDKITEKILYKEKLKSWLSIWLLIPKIDTPAKVGIDNKKEIFAASILLKCKNLAAVITIPDLLTPGIRENICITPIINAYL